MRKPTLWILTRSDTNQALQPLEMARDLKFWIQEVHVLHYPSRENKGTDQLRGYREADLRLCFHICKMLVFSWRGSLWISSAEVKHNLRTFLAHLSQRLIGELIGYSWSGVRAVVRRRPSLTISNFFFSETAWPIKAKFYVDPPWVGGTKVCSLHLSHMTKMAATPVYGKNPSKIFFSRTGRPIFTKLGM